jgi:hypothetical protein
VHTGYKCRQAHVVLQAFLVLQAAVVLQTYVCCVTPGCSRCRSLQEQATLLATSLAT